MLCKGGLYSYTASMHENSILVPDMLRCINNRDLPYLTFRDLSPRQVYVVWCLFAAVPVDITYLVSLEGHEVKHVSSISKH